MSQALHDAVAKNHSCLDDVMAWKSINSGHFLINRIVFPAVEKFPVSDV